MSDTFEKTQSQYERKMARQKQLDMMEAAASGQAYSEALQGGSPPDAGSVSSSAASSIGGIHASPYGAPPEGAIESARRFLWDEEEDQAGEGMHNKRAPDDAQGFLGEKTAPGSSAGAVLNRLLGGFRGGGNVSSSGGNTTSRGTNSMWMADAAPRNNEAEEYMEKPRNARSVLASVGDCLVAVFHTVVGFCALLCESFMGCVASCNPRLVMVALGAIMGLGLFIFGITAVVHRTKNVKSNTDNTPADNGPQGPAAIKNAARFAALQDTILSSRFTADKHLNTDGTAQNLALRWLTDDDPAQLEVDDDSILQRYALAVFFFGSAGASNTWKRNDYWMTDKGICLWYGVACPPHLHEGVEETHYNQNSDVVKLNLTDNSVAGTLPSELRALENLETLDLGKNGLVGTLPKSLFYIETLKELYLEQNEFSGTIPEEVGKIRAVRDLFLGTNKFEGKIPDIIGTLTNLRALGLDENFLTGTIPNLWDLKKLLILYLDSNELTGTIPRDVRHLTDMMDFRLRKNSLNGTIPETIHQMSHLELFYVDDNELTGTIPELWDLMLRVQEIQLYKNKLSGNLPDSIHELKDLKLLYADNNELEGTIPASYGSLGDLHTFYAFNNRLRGDIPSELGKMEDLRDFQIYNNNIGGSIPSEMANCYKLRKFEVQDNKITGNVPSEFGTLENLSMLKVYRNNLQGQIPQPVCDAKRDFSLGFVAADCNLDLGGKLECPCCNSCYP